MPKHPITVEEFNERGVSPALQKLIVQAFDPIIEGETEKLTMVRRVANELARDAKAPRPGGGGGGTEF